MRRLILALACIAAGGSVCLPAPVLSAFQPNIPNGGRALAVDVNPADPSIALVAAESGGLFRTVDHGATWTHVDTMPNMRTIDVRYSPDDPNIVLASMWVDDFEQDFAGIWRSTDGGATWRRPPVDVPVSCAEHLRSWGISFLAGTTRVYAGTVCGVAVSGDRGASWTIQDVDPLRAPEAIYSVVAHRNLDPVNPVSHVDVCGPSGHYRLADPNGSSWVQPLSSGATGPTCERDAPHEIDASPYEPDVLFAATRIGGNTGLLESDDGGVTWTSLNPVTDNNRPPFVRVHAALSSDAGSIDVWFGNGGDSRPLQYQYCAGIAPGSRCSSAAGMWSDIAIDHPDTTDLAYEGPGAFQCPAYVTSDGGVHRPLTCDTWTSDWRMTGGGLDGYNALQIYDLTGQIGGSSTDLYFGTQDNGAWYSTDSGGTWQSLDGGDDYFMQVPRYGPPAPGDVVTWSNVPSGNRQSDPPPPVSVLTWNDPPAGSIGGFPWLLSHATYLQLAQPSVMGSGTASIWLTSDTGSNWSERLTLTQTLSTSRLFTSGPPAAPTVYKVVLKPGGVRGLLRITGLLTGPPLVQSADSGVSDIGTQCWGLGTFSCPDVVSVDPGDPNHLIAADVGSGSMMVSRDAGISWTPDTQLTALVTGGGTRRFATLIDGQAYAEVTSIAFDTFDHRRIMIGTDSAGIVASVDGGALWFLIPGSDRVAKPSSFFFDEVQDQVLISSYGRGIFRLAPLSEMVPNDTDDDGIADVVEQMRPGGPDGNGDGIDDSTQASVVSFPNAVDGRFITLAVASPRYFRNVTPSRKTSASPPPLASFPLGYIGFSIEGVPVGGKADVSLFAPAGVRLDSYYKYGHLTPFVADWYLFDYQAATLTGVELPSPAGGPAVLHLVDGQRGDDDLTANGVVVDPGGTSTRLEVASLDWSDPHTLTWSSLAGASLYKVHEGGKFTLTRLASIETDSCVRTTVQGDTTGPTLTGSPGNGDVRWYLVTASDPYGESAAGDATTGPRQLNSPGACGASCAHDKCFAGGPIEPSCDPCVADVCAADPSCCGANGWGPNCPGEVFPVCNNVSCFVPGQCAHTLCKTGTPLQPGCDQGAITPGCVALICNEDPSCCQQEWSATCVAEVSTICSLNCN